MLLVCFLALFLRFFFLSIWAFFLYFLIEYLPRFFFPLFAYRKGKKQTHFFIRVCGSISPSFFVCFHSSYIYIYFSCLCFCLHFSSILFGIDVFQMLTLALLYSKKFGSLSLYFFFLSIFDYFLSLSSSLFCWIYYFSLFLYRFQNFSGRIVLTGIHIF